jgi:hypothetical protein
LPETFSFERRFQGMPPRLSRVRMKSMSDPAKCPLCGQPNECQLCTVNTYKGPCWCAKVKISQDLLDQIPADLKNKVCVCKGCVEKSLREAHRKQPPPVKAGDFYFEAGGMLVFTEAYHLRRGYCCGSGCRHCPYE